jgi:hypothetical protein
MYLKEILFCYTIAKSGFYEYKTDLKLQKEPLKECVKAFWVT